jgi:hypothetical protein
LSSAIVVSVRATLGLARMARAMRSPMTRVSGRLVPSGARTDTWKRASSLTGRNPFGATLASGTQDPSVTREAPTTIHRWRMTNPSTRTYRRSTGR